MDIENTKLEETIPAEPTEESIFSEPESGQEAAPQAEAPEQPEEHPPAEAVYKIKYNGQEQELPVSQLVTLAQKGMNYDHVYGEMEQLRNAREFTVLDQFAQANGLTRDEYLNAIEQQEQNRQVQRQVQQGIPEDVARRILALEHEQNVRIERERAWKAQAEKQRQFGELAQEYPGITEFPQEVIDAIAQGETPLHAYRSWDLKQTKLRLETYKKNAEAREKTPGSAAGDAPQDAPDIFMDGFNSEFQ